MERGTVEALWRPLLEGEGGERGRGATFVAVLDEGARPDRDTALGVLATLHELGRKTVIAPPAEGEGGADRSATPGAYDVVGEIGRGGMAIVYRARQSVLGRDIALKRSRDGLDTKFVAEALVTAGLEHPNIVPVYDLVTSGERPALAMKLVGGRTWEQALDGAEAVKDLDFHLDVLLAVSNAIAFAHSHGIVHCDIKPENVLLGAFGEVLVVDWGIALDFRDDAPPGAVAPPRRALLSPCGTPAYLAPELALAEASHIGPRTDVYLLGATLYHVATGRAPRDGLDVVDALVAAASEERPTFSPKDDVPPGLRAVIERAMALRPADRYPPDVASFQAALRDFRRHKESLAIGERAAQALADCRRRPAGVLSDRDRNRLYTDYAEVVAAFRQALVLWPGNRPARAGEDAARLEFAEVARAHGDLSLAEAQAAHLFEPSDSEADAAPADLARARALLTRIGAEQAQRRRTHRRGRALKLAVALAALVIIVVLVIATLLVRDERDRASQSQRLAETRLEAIRQLSDVKHLDDLVAAAEGLWPAVPTRVAAMDGWLEGARALVSRLPEHRRALALLASRAGPDQRFPTVAEQWEHDTLAGLVRGIEALDAKLAPSVAARRDAAQTLAARSLEAPRAAWDAAIRRVAASPRYAGVTLTPQLGLVPLGADPDSGLEEFVHLPSGEPATRGGDGRLVIGEATGVVLVLLPGGEATLGARPPDALHPVGAPFVDAAARAHEGPVHTLRLAPFFMAKYELTQGQWQRVAGVNPSSYLPGRTIGGRTVTLAHPVEQVDQAESLGLVTKLGLTLPTEAQWEYAARGGTTTPYWTGEAKESLAGTLNIADTWCRTHEGPGSWAYESFLDDGYTSHAPVGSYRPNPFGLHDVNGNVWEWCADRYAAYDLPARVGDGLREGPAAAPYVFRGGGFRANASHARSADRYSLYGTAHRGFDIGLRAARPLEP